MSTGDEPPAHEDILKLLQVESVVKKVPSGLTNVRRIVQYANDPDDDGSIQDPLSATPPEAYFIWSIMLITALALVLLLAYYTRPTATEGGGGGGNEGGAASIPLRVPTRGSEEAIQLDFNDGSPRNSFMQSIMKTLKSLEE
ncbi:hypothetical protein HPB50_014681 [Hyalomma asiaticum]|uniref:Uncharacterized protein n=1 Tax=Hyalomma asiaticum TaxID=266040 RepID=A0ACB7SYA8_HYAAI|nr:hypothetical protein HPB50_014681 [Hyalomma asiaticum]